MAKNQALRNSAIFNDYYTRLKNIAVSVFEWEGLPESCNARFLENCLFNNGRAVFVNDPVTSFLTLNVTNEGVLNVYNEPTAYRAFSTGYNEVFHADECVIIHNNPVDRSTESTIILIAEKLACIDISMTVNINAQKTPLLLRCDDKTKTTLKAIYAQYDGNEPVIFGHKALQEKPIEAIQTGAPFVADKLREEKRAVWNEALEFLGLNTNPSDKKKERLIVSEVDSNNEQTEIQFESMLHERMRACKEINEKFGLNVSVRKRTKEVVNNGDIYNRT